MSRITKRTLLRSTVTLGAAPSLAACGAAQSAPPKEKGPVTIRLATDWVSGPRGDTMKVAIPAFQERNPLVKVEVEAITGDYWTAVNTQLAAGTIQELVLFEGNFFHSFKDGGAFTPIDSILKQHKVSMGDYSVVPGIYQDKGKQYGMPFQLVASGWRYNVDLFQERGIKAPDDTWTWDDVLAAAQKLTSPERGIYGVHVQDDTQFGWAPFCYSAGARWTNADKTKTTIADNGGAEAFQWYIDLIHKYHVSPTADEAKEIRGSLPNPFAAGKIGMLPQGLQSIGATVRQVADRFRWALMPTPKHPKTKKATHHWNDQPHVLTSAAQKKGVVEEAALLAIFLAGDVVQGRIAVERGSIPVLKKLQSGGDYLKPPPDNMAQVAKNLSDPDVQTPNFMKGWDEWWKAVTGVGAAFEGKVNAAQALRSAAQQADVVLARYGPQR